MPQELTGSASLTFTYDSLTPILAIALAHDTGGTDNITYNDTLTGRADARARVTLSEGSTVLGTTTAKCQRRVVVHADRPSSRRAHHHRERNEFIGI